MPHASPCVVATIVLCLALNAGRLTAFVGPFYSSDSNLGPYVHQATLVRSDGAAADDSFGRRIAIGGDTALVNGSDRVYVFDRAPGSDEWRESAPITLPNPVDGFPGALDFDGRTAMVGVPGAAHLFHRDGRGGWMLVATLRPPDGPAERFGSSVAIRGNLAMVGAPVDFVPDEVRSGSAYIFQRAASGEWTELARLRSATTTGFAAGFGGRVAISRTAALVTDSFDRGAWHLFRREGDGWPLVRYFNGSAVVVPFDVAVDDHTAVFAGGYINNSLAVVFGRNQGGVKTWGEQARFNGAEIPSACCGIFGASLSGHTIALGFAGGSHGAHILARNQGGANAWGQVSRLRDPRGTRFGEATLGIAVAVDGDTALIGSVGPTLGTSSGDDNAVFVLVLDVDRDGLRDGTDPCPRDPLNNTEPRCRREIAVNPIVEDLVDHTPFSTTTRGRLQVLTATYTNNSLTPIRNPFFEVVAINGENLLANADEGPAGIGATLSPDVGDGVLSPGESMRVEFAIRQRSTSEPVTLTAVLRGEVLAMSPECPPNSMCAAPLR
jgi:FG-GAP repeat